MLTSWFPNEIFFHEENSEIKHKACDYKTCYVKFSLDKALMLLKIYVYVQMLLALWLSYVPINQL